LLREQQGDTQVGTATVSESVSETTCARFTRSTRHAHSSETRRPQPSAVRPGWFTIHNDDYESAVYSVPARGRFLLRRRIDGQAIESPDPRRKGSPHTVGRQERIGQTPDVRHVRGRQANIGGISRQGRQCEHRESGECHCENQSALEVLLQP
jgi:hypothetical protein